MPRRSPWPGPNQTNTRLPAFRKTNRGCTTTPCLPTDNLSTEFSCVASLLASEVKALFTAGVPARWDHEYFYQHATGPAMPHRTLFEGVHQVPPGHYLMANPGGMQVLRYWEFN